MRIELTEQQLNALRAFLNRVQLQGNEAETLVMLKGLLRNSARVQPEPEKVEKKDKS